MGRMDSSADFFALERIISLMRYGGPVERTFATGVLTVREVCDGLESFHQQAEHCDGIRGFRLCRRDRAWGFLGHKTHRNRRTGGCITSRRFCFAHRQSWRVPLA